MTKRTFKKLILAMLPLSFGAIIRPAGAENISKEKLNEELRATAWFGDNKNLKKLKKLIASKADVNSFETQEQVTALMIAAHSGHMPVVKCLIEKHANVNQARSDDGATPIMMAAYHGHTPAIKYLLEMHADVNQAKSDDGVTPLMMAVQNGHAPTVKCLVDARANIDQARDDGTTPLLFAAGNGHAAVVKYLIDTHANVNYSHQTNNYSALYAAAIKGYRDIIEDLIAAGAHINLANHNGVTPLMMAIKNEYPKTVSVLFDAHCLQLIAPFRMAIKNVDAIIKQKNSSPTSSDKNTQTTLNTDKISAIENLPIDCLRIVMHNLSPKSVAHFRQSSRSCKNAAEYEYIQQLKKNIALKQQNHLTPIITQALTYAATAPEQTDWQTDKNRAAIVALLQSMLECDRHLWKIALEIQPVCTPADRTYYEESCAQRDTSRPCCAIS